MPPNEIRSGTPSVVRMLIGRSQTLPSLLLPHSRSVSNSLRRREPGFAPRMHGCGRRLPRCRRSPRLSAGTILARVAAAKSLRSAASIEGLPGSPYRACCKEGAPQTGAISSFSNPFSLATLTVDTKKKERIGPFKNGGSDYRPKGSPEAVNVHDFADKTLGKVAPDGIYDPLDNRGWVSLGIDHDTAEFAGNAIPTWHERIGRVRHRGSDRLLITADCGGSNGARGRVWKV